MSTRNTEKHLYTFSRNNIDNHINSNAISGEQNSRLGYKKFGIIIFLFLLILLIKNFCIDKVIISGESMLPTLKNENVCLMKKWGVSNIKRYDIVIAKTDKKHVVKRVVGMPNDTVQIKDNTVYINGQRIIDEYDFPTAYSGIAEHGITIKEGEYFLLGDNRNNSIDSREFGVVKSSDITGIVITKIFPFPVKNF